MTIKQLLESQSHRQLAADIGRWKKRLNGLESMKPGQPSSAKDLLASKIALYETFLKSKGYKLE
jgi:hypothetical protein